MSVRTYTVKDGLSSTYVWSVYQDKLGYLWIGSPEGLNRFNGKNFTTYGLADGLPDIRASGGFMDSQLRYWVTTTRGIVELKGNKFISYPFSDSQKIRWLAKIFETTDGQVWALTDVGAYRFNLNKWDKIKLYPGYENHSCIGIVETKEGLYINYGDLLVLRRTDNTYKIIGTFRKPGYYYNSLTSSAGEIFISTVDGLFKIINEQLIKQPGALGKLKGIYTYFRDSKKRFWLARANIGIQLLAANDSTQLITLYKGPPGFLPQHITEDNQGNIWVASGNGLIRMAEMGLKNFAPILLIEKTVFRNVMQPPSGPLLINNGCLTLQALENGVVHKKKLQLKGKTPLPNNELIIDNYAFDNKGRYWYSVRGYALVLQEGNNLYVQSKQLAHLGDEVFDVLFDSYRKKILVAVRTQKYPCQFNDTFYSILPVTNNINVKGNILHLHQCTNGTILFATDQGLIYSIDKQNTCKLQLNEFNAEGRIRWFYNDPNGDTWILYNGRGLRCYAWQNGLLVFKEQLTKANGLTSDNITSLCFDSKNNLWVSTNSNIAVYSKVIDKENMQSYQLVSFFDTQDLGIGDSYDTKLSEDLRGNIWLFSGQHLICIYTDKINFKSPVPSIKIENVELNLKQTNWADYADSLSGIFQLPYNLKLTHYNNTLGIYFKGISSSGTEGLKYSYQLEGLENLWSTTSSNDFVSFVKLPAGKYTFKVKAQLPNTKWSEPAIFSFEIKKAFWQTWWFFISAGIVLSAGIYTLFRYRLKQKVNVLELRNRFSQDLHDEIGASMSGINLFSQMAAEKLQQHKPEEASENINKVKIYTQDVIEKLSDMVWIFNPQNDSIEKLLERLRSFALSIAVSKNIQVHFATDKESEMINLSIRQRKAIYLISKEAIINSFKYAACNNIYYSLTSTGFKWQLQVRDDGKGFIPTENKKGNGLKNMQARADEIGATFSIQSQTNYGTTITLKL